MGPPSYTSIDRVPITCVQGDFIYRYTWGVYMYVYGYPTTCTYEGPIKHIDTGTSSYICAYGPHPMCVHMFFIIHIHVYSIMHRSRDYIYMYTGTHHIHIHWNPITCLCTDLPTHVYRAPLHMLTQGSIMYVQRDIIHIYFQRLEHACAHKYPIILVYAKVIHTQSPYHMCHMYTETPSTHMHIKALSHLCTQEFHNHICVRDPCPNWYVHIDLS